MGWLGSVLGGWLGGWLGGGAAEPEQPEQAPGFYWWRRRRGVEAPAIRAVAPSLALVQAQRCRHGTAAATARSHASIRPALSAGVIIACRSGWAIRPAIVLPAGAVLHAPASAQVRAVAEHRDDEELLLLMAAAGLLG